MISIFTPTFNRAEMLLALKNSIDAQVCKDFEWIIVDDGSTDNTRKLTTVWMEQKPPYRLKYIWQENQGKQSAFNTAVKEAIGEWFICVDSDDHLTENAVKIMNTDINSIKDDCIGIVYPTVLTGSDKEKEWKQLDGKKVDIMDLKALYGIPESAILMRKSDIEFLPFPRIKGEKFIPEGWLYQKLMAKGKFKVHNAFFYIAEYQPDGMTKNVWNLWARNSVGVLEVLREKYRLLDKYPLKKRIVEKAKCLININAICIKAGKKSKDESPAPIFGFVLMLPSFYFYKKRFGRKRK
ncbi:glycosyltransferase family 2 protein [Faecalibaculum rodentium]|uniref:glycosyltransferase family 2 protein n=1 Tax=Faecalibaculum rodentium TaxID=1702221 RepID=UPI003517E2E1